WTKPAKDQLSELLRIQGNADWSFDFGQRQYIRSGADRLFSVGDGPRKSKAGTKAKADPGPQTVVLFSGGLDSTSGLASLMDRAEEILLVGHYTQNRTKPARIARKLGFKRFIQIKTTWSLGQRAGGQFQYRSFFFLSLAAVLANAARASTILQFE